MGDLRKAYVFVAVINSIAEQDETVAMDLKSEYLRAASDSMSEAAEQFFEDWHMLLITYPDTGRLNSYLQNQAETRSQWARTFLGNAPLIADSVVA